MAKQISIRPVEKEDCEAIGLVYLRAFEKNEKHLKYYTKFDEYVGFCMKQGYAFVLEADSVIAGVILGYEKPDYFCGRRLYIELLAVMPEFQGKGYGKALIERFEQAAKENGISDLCLRTGCYMDAYLIYRHLGFKDMQEDQRFLVRHIGAK